MTESPAKSKNDEKNEAKRLAKAAKFEAKQKMQDEAAKAKLQKPDTMKKKEEVTPKDEPNYVNITPKGEKKILGDEFPATYKPKAVESAWYDWWETKGFFKPQMKADGSPFDEGTYVIPIPPPNITGSLHIGHALTNSIQDTMTRWNRMKGKTTLWVPGADHAGIATQIVVEKKLMRERNLTRHQLGRDKFVDEIYKWKDNYIDRIYNQLRRLGGSFDWDRSRFTMDPMLCKAVNEAFVLMHDDGTIYRANRLVNWDTKLKTALSNLEVESRELEGRTMMSVPDHDPSKKYEFGVLISFAYQVENSDERIVVATTRLETMMGDTCIAVHPSDKRYLHLHGKYVIHPFQNRRIPILADEYPDPEFGTGAVKITPAHDFNDFIVGKRQNIEFINIFTDDGQMNENGAPFTGMQRFDARVAILEALKEKGLYVGTQDNKMVLPICGRSGNIVEPLMKPQWWINCQSMASQAVEVVKSGQLTITPAASEKEWYRWLETPQDWCISRQLWWGHRIPAYFVVIEGDVNDRTIDDRWVSGRTIEEAKERAIKKFSSFASPEKISIEQDEDVLDTWFSSGLWPFSIMGWPEKTKDMDNFFPNSLLETGWDILFFWVARMVMMSLKLTGKVPFSQVFCHAMIRDAHGRKMSKSLGNVIDPLDVIDGITLEELQTRLDQGNLDPKEVQKAKEGQKKDYPNGIPLCGTDALRFTLLAYTSSGRDINMDIKRVDGYSKFCNKLWNATRFANLKLGDNYIPRINGKESLAGKWILHKLNKAIQNTNHNLEQMNFMQATNAAYQFWLYELCDVYLEVCKPVFEGQDIEAKEAAQDVLYICLVEGLKLLHPFMPFVTEELYQRLPRRPQDATESIMMSKFPQYKSEWDWSQNESDFEYVNSVVGASRSLMSEYNIKKNASVFVVTGHVHKQKLIRQQLEVCKSLIKGCDSLTVVEEVPEGCALSTAVSETSVYLLVKGQVDLSLELEKYRQKLEKMVIIADGLEQKMGVEEYKKQVKLEVIQIDVEKLNGYKNEIAAIQKSIGQFEKFL